MSDIVGIIMASGIVVFFCALVAIIVVYVMSWTCPIKDYLCKFGVYTDLTYEEYENLTVEETAILNRLIETKQRYLALEGYYPITFEEFADKSPQQQKVLVKDHQRNVMDYKKYGFDMPFKEFCNLACLERTRLLENTTVDIEKSMLRRIKK